MRYQRFCHWLVVTSLLALPYRASAQQADTTRWHYITRTTAFVVSFDAATIRKDQDTGNVVTWLRFYYNRTQRGTPESDRKPFRYILTQVEYDCSARQMSLRSLNFYSRNGALVSTVNAVYTREGLPQDIAPSSTGEIILGAVCDWASAH